MVVVAHPAVDPGDGPSGSSYASVANIRAVYETTATDEQIELALAFASALVDACAGRPFGPVASQKVFDVRTDTVVLPIKGQVDEVLVGEAVMPITSYELTTWGLRFYEPQSGVFYNPGHPLTVEPVRRWWGNNRGVTVTVTGTFGDSVPALIKEATILLAIDRLSALTAGAVGAIPELPGNVTSFSVEGLSVSFDATTARNESVNASRSTGNVTADRLIRLALGTSVVVA